MQKRLAPILAQQPLRRRPTLAVIAADRPERAARSGTHDTEQPLIRQLDNGRLLAGAGLGVTRERYRKSIVVRSEPADLQFRNLWIIIEVVKTHEFHAGIMGYPGPGGIFCNRLTRPAGKARQVAPVFAEA